MTKQKNQTDEKNLLFLENIRKILNHIDKGKLLDNSHIKEIWLRLDMLEKEIKNGNN